MGQLNYLIMKKLILTSSFIFATIVSFAFNDSKQPTEEVLPECKRATLSCGESGVACGKTMKEVDAIIEEAENYYCG